MTEKPFTNREIRLMFEGQGEQIKEVHKDVKEVLEQTKKTNGRVSKLESWQAYIKGGLTILSILVVPILIYIITKGL